MKRILVLVLSALAALAPGAAFAQAAAPAAPRAINIPGVSPAGIAVLAKFNTQDDPQLRQLLVQQRGLRDQMANAIMTPAIDVDRIAALLQKGDALTGQVRQRQNVRVLAVLRALPAADRGPFLRAVANPGTVGRPAP